MFISTTHIQTFSDLPLKKVLVQVIRMGHDFGTQL